MKRVNTDPLIRVVWDNPGVNREIFDMIWVNVRSRVWISTAFVRDAVSAQIQEDESK